jgi:NTE family protein
LKTTNTRRIYFFSIKRLGIFLVLLLLNAQFLKAQDTIRRPKIGLVLSGGGAKGFAHIGVLKVLEEAGVKIDYIGGTSMGAVIGSLYATGYSAKQIDSIFTTTNFDELLSDYIPRDSKSFYEKRNDEMYALTLPFDKMTIGVPIALSRGLYNYNLLTKLMHKVRYVRDFNQLPIPFVCVATNIETGEQEVLRNGYLPEALLASSAFPSLFSPVKINGKLLIDGGVTNNYPVEELRKMGAEIIIGVDVQDDLQTQENLKEATRILVQISNMEMIESMKVKQKLTDYYIKPDIKDFNVISFEKGPEIIKRGEDAARNYWNDFKKLRYKAYTLQEIVVRPDSLQVDRITINAVKDYTRAYVIGKLGFKQGTKISYDDLKKGINKLTATGNFSAILFQINPFNDGDELELKLTESNNKSFLRFGLHYDGLYKSAALVNFTQKKTLFKNDVLSVDFGLGDRFRYNLDYYIDNGFYFSFGLKSRYYQFNRNVETDFSNGEFFSQEGISSLNIDYSDFTNQAYIQTIFAQKFLLGGGLEWKLLKIKSKTLENTKQYFENSDYLSVFGYMKYDSFDNKYFPKKGWFFNGEINSYLYSSDYTNNFDRFTVVKGEAGITRTFYKYFNLRLVSEMGITMGSNNTHFLDFVLGGYGFYTINNFRHFYGYDFVGAAADSYIKSVATVDVEFYKKNHLNFSANYANLANKLFETGDWLSKPKLSGYAVGYGLETVLGPIEAKYTWSPEKPKGFFWFSVGFWF